MMYSSRAQVLFCFCFAIMFVSFNANATIWCGYFRGDFNDANKGEDRDTSTAEQDYPARYAKGTLRKYNGVFWETKWSGYLSEEGCTPDQIAPTAGEVWLLGVYTELKRSNRVIIVKSITDTGWGSTTIPYMYTMINVPNPVPGTIHVSAVTPMTEESGLASGLGMFMYYSSTLDHEDGTVTHVGVDVTTLCEANGNAGYDSAIGAFRVCLPSAHTKKFIQNHEMGHMIAESNSGPLGEGADAGDTGPFIPADVDCRFSNCIEGAGHCLNSREYIGMAYQEGFAHFVSSRTYNNQTQTTNQGGYGYYKSVAEGAFNPDTDGGDCHPTTYKVDITGDDNINEDTDSDLVKWVETECDPSADGYSGLGSEWDWLVFFWNLHTVGSDVFSVSDINDVWAGVEDWRGAWCCNPAGSTNCTPRSSQYQVCPFAGEWVTMGKSWDALEDWVDNNMSQDELDQFQNRGADARVDY